MKKEKINLIKFHLDKEKLRKEFPLKTTKQTKNGITEVYEKYSSLIIAKYVEADAFEGMYFYKENAEKDGNIFQKNEGYLKYYEEKIGLFKQLDENYIQEKIAVFFEKRENSVILTKNCLGAGLYGKYEKELIKIITDDLLRFCKDNNLHWSNTFEKGYLGIVVNNGTLLLDYKKNEINFKKDEWNPKYLADYKLDIEYNEEQMKKRIFEKDNRFYNFLNAKLELDTIGKKDLFLSVFFDLFLTENQSQHLVFFVGKAKSGKSTFIDYISELKYFNLWGEATNIEDLLSKFTKEDVFGKNLIISDETSEKYIENKHLFKIIISKGKIKSEQKFKDGKTVQVCAKIVGVGEKPLELKNDGGMDRRMMYFSFSSKKIEIGDGEDIKPYLNQTKNIDFLEMLIVGMEKFCKNEFGKTPTSMMNKYEKIYNDVISKINKEHSTFTEEMIQVFKPEEGSVISLGEAKKVMEILDSANKKIKISTFKEQFELNAKKIEGFENIKCFVDGNRRHFVETMKGEMKEIKKGNNFLLNCTFNAEGIKTLLLNKNKKENTNEFFYQHIPFVLKKEETEKLMVRYKELNNETITFDDETSHDEKNEKELIKKVIEEMFGTGKSEEQILELVKKEINVFKKKTEMNKKKNENEQLKIRVFDFFSGNTEIMEEGA